jgi:hypothetical protein
MHNFKRDKYKISHYDWPKLRITPYSIGPCSWLKLQITPCDIKIIYRSSGKAKITVYYIKSIFVK